MMPKILDKRLIILYIAPFFLGLLTVFTFQPFNFSFINFITLPLIFYLTIYVKKRSKSIYRKKPYMKNLFLVGFMFGFGFYLSGIFWISYSLTFDENFKFLIPFAIIIIPLFLALFLGLTTLIVGQFLNYNFSSILLFSGSFGLSDYLRSKILTGFPWNLWGYSWSWVSEILQTLNIFGLFAFNLIVITIFVMPAAIFFRESSFKKITIFSILFLFIFIIYIFGTFSINKNKALTNYLSEFDTVHVKVISPNFKLEYNSSLEEIKKKLEKLIRYSNPDPIKNTFFIWPEGVFAGYSFEEISEFKKLIRNKFSPNHRIIFGVNTLNTKSGNYFNSLLIVNHNFEILYKYNKEKLVPFW